MGDFADDTTVEGGEGHYSAHLSRDWEIWGPNGGYLAAIALRAAGAASNFDRPATFAGHFLSVAQFGSVDIEVTPLRTAKRAQSLRISMAQNQTPIFEALVWTVAPGTGLEHDASSLDDVPAPEDLPSMAELRGPDGPYHAFWRNFDERPLQWNPTAAPRERPPILKTWLRFLTDGDMSDPFLDAARSLLLIDTMLWPAAWRHHGDSGFIAPSLDVNAHFHRPAATSPWLLIEAEAPIATAGLLAGRARVWSRDGQLVASGTGHLACRPVRT